MEGPDLAKGVVLEGKWSKSKYKLIEKIGEGGIGAVYLVKDLKMKRDYAMKISKDSLSLNREYQLLKKFDKIDIIVNTYELDDCTIEGSIYHYILLEYVRGTDLKKYVEKRQLNKITILAIILIILKGLQALHAEEYIMADVKLENIMFDQQNKSIKMIDLGGITRKGRGIKEFTPLYDRGSWRCGDRIAEESYDLFAVTMLFIKLLVRGEVNPRRQTIDDVLIMVKKTGIQGELLDCITQGLTSKKIATPYLINRMKALYALERINKRQKQILLRGRKIDMLLMGSVILFLSVMLLIIVK